MTFGERIAALPAPSKVGFALCLVGFVVSINCSQTTTEDGALTSCSYFDIGVLGIAAGLVWCASATGWNAGADDDEVRFRRNVTLVLLAFAAIHALRAFGGLGAGPC